MRSGKRAALTQPLSDRLLSIDVIFITSLRSEIEHECKRDDERNSYGNRL
jgi:hypothetical protein